jgi:hypothetical protein
MHYTQLPAEILKEGKTLLSNFTSNLAAVNTWSLFDGLDGSLAIVKESPLE